MGKTYVLYGPLDGQGTSAWLPNGYRLSAFQGMTFLLNVTRLQDTFTMKLAYRISGRCGKETGDIDTLPIYLPSAVSTALQSFGVTFPVTCDGSHPGDVEVSITPASDDPQNIAATLSDDSLPAPEREELILYIDDVSTSSIGYQPSMQSWLRECSRGPGQTLPPVALSIDVTSAPPGCYIVAVVRGKQMLLQVGMENGVVFYPSRVLGTQFASVPAPVCRLETGKTMGANNANLGVPVTPLMDTLNTVHWSALQQRLRSILVESSLSSVDFGFSMDFLVLQGPEGSGKTLFLHSLHRAWKDVTDTDILYCDIALDQDVDALLDWCRIQEQCHGDVGSPVVYLVDNLDLLYGSALDSAVQRALGALQNCLSIMHSSRGQGAVRILGACRDIHELPRQIRDDIDDTLSLPALSPSTISTILAIFLEHYIYPHCMTTQSGGGVSDGKYSDIIQATRDLTRGLSLRAIHNAVQLVAIKYKGNDDDGDDDDGDGDDGDDDDDDGDGDGDVLVFPSSARVTQLLVEALRSATSTTQYLPRGDIGITAWDDVLGYSEVKQRLLEAIEWPLNHSEAMDRFHLPRSSGILLYGPSGCGKSYVTRALSHKAGVTLLTVSGPELLSKYLGESEKRVRQLFEHARSVSPCLLCFDQLDTLARTRQSNDDAGGNDVHSRVLTQLLTEMDGVTERGLVFVIACTSRPDLIDPAMLRPGRLDQHIHMPIPDAASREALITGWIARHPSLSYPPTTPVDLARDSHGFSCADVRYVLQHASRAVLRRRLQTGGEEDLGEMYTVTADDITTATSMVRQGRLQDTTSQMACMTFGSKPIF